MRDICVYKPDAFPITCPELTQTAFWTPLAIRSRSPRSSDVCRLTVECWIDRHRRNAAVNGGMSLLFPIAKIFFIMQSSSLLSYCRLQMCPAGDFKRGRSCFWRSVPSEAWRSVQVLQRLTSPAWYVENAEVVWLTIQGITFRQWSGPYFSSFFKERSNTFSLCILSWPR